MDLNPENDSREVFMGWGGSRGVGSNLIAFSRSISAALFQSAIGGVCMFAPLGFVYLDSCPTSLRALSLSCKSAIPTLKFPISSSSCRSQLCLFV